MFIGMRPKFNISASNPNQYRDWHNLTLLTDNSCDSSATAHSQVMTDDAVPFNDVSIKHKFAFSQELSERTVFPSSTDTIDTLQLPAHGITIYMQVRRPFYRDYLPWVFGEEKLITPYDLGAFCMTFNLYPGSYQPSGHINVSRARELYLQFTSSYVNSSNPSDRLLSVKSEHGRATFLP